MTDNNTSTETIFKDGASLQIEDGPVQNKPPKKKKTWEEWVNPAIQLLVILLLWAYFIWATHYFVANTTESLDATTCTGYGFLMILFIFINFGIGYRLALKPYFFPVFEKHVWDPCVTLLKKIK